MNFLKKILQFFVGLIGFAVFAMTVLNFVVVSVSAYIQTFVLPSGFVGIVTYQWAVIAAYFVLAAVALLVLWKYFRHSYPSIVYGALFGLLAFLIYMGGTIAMIRFNTPPTTNVGNIIPEGVSKSEEEGVDIAAHLKTVQLSLELYLDMNGSYPQKLSDLIPQFLANDSPLKFNGIPHTYSLISPTEYHLGTSMTNTKSAYLSVDADYVSSGFDGTDSKGCSGEPNMACFDILASTGIPDPVQR